MTKFYILTFVTLMFWIDVGAIFLSLTSEHPLLALIVCTSVLLPYSVGVVAEAIKDWKSL